MEKRLEDKKLTEGAGGKKADASAAAAGTC